MYFQCDEVPDISVAMWLSTWMSRYLTDGLVVVVHRIGHCSHQTSLSLDFLVWGYLKNMVCEHKVNRRGERHHYIFYAAMTFEFYIRFKSSWIWNIRGFITAENNTYVHMTFPWEWHWNKILSTGIVTRHSLFSKTDCSFCEILKDPFGN
jgi:hypothetical protein